jgi:hypothetical protein
MKEEERQKEYLFTSCLDPVTRTFHDPVPSQAEPSKRDDKRFGLDVLSRPLGGGEGEKGKEPRRLTLLARDEAERDGWLAALMGQIREADSTWRADGFTNLDVEAQIKCAVIDLSLMWGASLGKYCLFP